MWAVIWSEQLKTIQRRPNALAKSFVDYVLPVPAGPAGLAPSLFAMADVIVIQHRSVKGVITSREVAPKYSYPYSNSDVTCRWIVLSSLE
jgi:hypothetical protein